MIVLTLALALLGPVRPTAPPAGPPTMTPRPGTVGGVIYCPTLTVTPTVAAVAQATDELTPTPLPSDTPVPTRTPAPTATRTREPLPTYIWPTDTLTPEPTAYVTAEVTREVTRVVIVTATPGPRVCFAQTARVWLPVMVTRRPR